MTGNHQTVVGVVVFFQISFPLDKLPLITRRKVVKKSRSITQLTSPLRNAWDGNMPLGQVQYVQRNSVSLLLVTGFARTPSKTVIRPGFSRLAAKNYP